MDETENQLEQTILSYFTDHKKTYFTLYDIQKALPEISYDATSRILDKLTNDGVLISSGSGYSITNSWKLK